MAKAVVLTDGAKFKCAHMPAPIGITEGITISLTASKVKVGNAKPILNGAIISGFTTDKGCTFQISGAPAPCVSFALSMAPATGMLVDSNQKVYTVTDSASIALAPSSGNGNPGLTIIESQTQLKA